MIIPSLQKPLQKGQKASLNLQGDSTRVKACFGWNVDFARVNQNIKKILFVMTINEAFQQNLNFSMIKDAYIRILDTNSQSELLSYRMEQYYANATSMTIGARVLWEPVIHSCPRFLR